MSLAEPDAVLAQAGEAMARQAWDEAFELLSQADRAGALDVEALPVLADAAYLAGHPETSVDAWERVHQANVRSGDTAAAAAKESPDFTLAAWTRSQASTATSGWPAR